ncbi:hypothetical protein [Aquabacterium sp.]|uniref:hypothetical protein n=1 Tax=Aquabacterium sp. TaxID=1872578 RepID=UPI002B86E1B0|nr:hypothetical protein [Aquabacterium sp.]HSW09213.1 hypothetical protein [Aquabacterium sp.]
MKRKTAPKTSRPDPQNHGEGNREAARRYNADQQDFVKSGKAEAAAQRAAPRSDEEAADLARAEREGRRHAKEEDPTVPGANAAKGQDELSDEDAEPRRDQRKNMDKRDEIRPPKRQG